MKTPIRTSSFAALVLAAVATPLLFAAPQVQTPTRSLATPIVVPTLPAYKAQDIVNYEGYAWLPTPGTHFIVASVPFDKWLVLTDVEYSPGGSGGMRLDQKLGASFEVRRGAPFLATMASLHSSVGLAFAPGSEVVLHNIGSGIADGSYQMSGYLIDP